MQTTNFQIKNRTIIREDNIKLIGIVGQDEFKVDFQDTEWEGLHKTMKLIRSDGNVYKFAMLNDAVILTQECYVEGMAKLGFYGTINEDDPEEMEIASTDYLPIYITQHAYDTEDGEQQNLPTPSQWDIIIGELNEIVDKFTYTDIKNKPQTWNSLVGDN